MNGAVGNILHKLREGVDVFADCDPECLIHTHKSQEYMLNFDTIVMFLNKQTRITQHKPPQYEFIYFFLAI